MSKKESLMRIAARHFAKYGYEGVSLDAIAKETGITKAAIYYHFKDKAHLYEAVLLERLRGLVEHIEQVLPSKGAKERLERYIEGFGSFLEQNPCFAAILAHEFADNGAHMSQEATLLLSRTLGILTSILNEGIEEGVFEMENPMVVQMMIVSTLVMHQTTTQLRHKVSSFVSGYEVLPEPTIEDVAKVLAKKIRKAIRKE